MLYSFLIAAMYSFTAQYSSANLAQRPCSQPVHYSAYLKAFHLARLAFAYTQSASGPQQRNINTASILLNTEVSSLTV